MNLVTDFKHITTDSNISVSFTCYFCHPHNGANSYREVEWGRREIYLFPAQASLLSQDYTAR